MYKGKFGFVEGLRSVDSIRRTLEIEKEINPLFDKAVFGKDVTMTVKFYLGGLQFRFEKKGKFLASVILHSGSYGRESGLFEICPAHPPLSWKDSVMGHLSFDDCLKIVKREAKMIE